MSELGCVQVLDAKGACPSLPVVAENGRAWAVLWPGVGGNARSMSRISLAVGGRTVVLRHPMEAAYYVISGSGVAQESPEYAGNALVEGAMVHIEPDTPYIFTAAEEGMELLGGPCPADPALFGALD